MFTTSNNRSSILTAAYCSTSSLWNDKSICKNEFTFSKRNFKSSKCTSYTFTNSISRALEYEQEEEESFV